MWERQFGYNEKYIETLAKYPRVLKDLQDTRERRNKHSQAEDASCRVLAMRKENLDRLCDHASDQDRQDKNVMDMRVKFEEDLEQFSSHQIDSNLSPEERERLLNLLEKRSESLKELQDVNRNLTEANRLLLVLHLSSMHGLRSNLSLEEHEALEKNQPRLQKERATWQEQYKVLQKQCEDLQDLYDTTAARQSLDPSEQSNLR
jgi:hypothetical protein